MSLVFAIDDDPAALISMVSLLESYKYAVRAFQTAEQFLESPDKHQRGCLLCDVSLPGMNGLDLYLALKKEAIHMPVILVSGYADADLVTKALAEGVIAVLEKPVDPEALRAYLESAMHGLG